MTINERVKKLRNELRMSQKEFATSLGFQQSYYSNIESGRRNVTHKLIKSLSEKYNVSAEWMYHGNGEMFLYNSENNVPVNNVPVTYHSEIKTDKNMRKYDPIDAYMSLNDKDLDYELSIEIEQLKEDYTAKKKLTEAIHAIHPPAFFKEKFPLMPDFKEYRKLIEEDFDEDHGHMKESSMYKIFKINNLYKSEQEHKRFQLGTLINYFHQYSGLFNNTKEAKDLMTD